MKKELLTDEIKDAIRYQMKYNDQPQVELIANKKSAMICVYLCGDDVENGLNDDKTDDKQKRFECLVNAVVPLVYHIMRNCDPEEKMTWWKGIKDAVVTACDEADEDRRSDKKEIKIEKEQSEMLAKAVEDVMRKIKEEMKSRK